MKKLIYTLILVLSLTFYSCKESVIGQYPVEFNPPGVVTNVSYDSLPGAINLNYTTPKDPDLLYVKATYFLDNGTKMEAAASAYTNQLLIDGYGNNDSLRTVILNAVDLNQNVSAPIIIKVKPKKSPIYDVKNSLIADKDFGGIYLKWKNPLQAKLIVVVTTPDNSGKPILAIGGKFYSSISDALVNVRGYDSIPRTFYIQVMDRWGNKSKMDTLKVTPIFEQLISKAYHAKWNGDATIPYQEYNSSYGVANVWNNKFGSTSGADCYSTKSGGGVSTSFTYDLNSQANNNTGKGWIIPSRLKLYARSGAGYSAIGEYIRVWGSTSPDVSTTKTGVNAWKLLGSQLGGYHITPPSGKTGPLATTDDKAYVENTGYDIVFPPGSPAIRYVRIEMVSMWSGGSATGHTVGEITWYGKVQ
ncbi:MAG: DUF4959 domain-containing protein [Paludibacter sp.]|nr:DUF4959 domain-containing protein [Paludibacter sp.]